MNALEDRLRAAARAAAGTVADGSAPPLVLPRRARRLTGRIWGGGRHPWLVAAAAAAAVLALISGSVLAAHLVVPGARRPAPSSPAQLAGGVPAYFLEFPVPNQVTAGTKRVAPILGSSFTRALPRNPETVRIVATATGKVAATIKMPGYVTAIAASPGAFYAAVLLNGETRFYEIRHVRPGLTTMVLLPVPPDHAQVEFMAASPDGAELAFSTLAGRSLKAHKLVVASTTGGSERAWSTPARYSAGSLGPMNWLAGGRTLAFNWSGSLAASAVTSLRLLDTAAPGTDVMASRAVLPSVFEAHAFSSYTALSPNGQAVVGVASGYATQGSVVAFSTATGKPTVLLRASPGGGHQSICYGLPLWVSNDGSDVLAACSLQIKPTPPAMKGYVVSILLIDHARATQLPWLDATAEGFTAFP
jgi:hypothetical protein